MNWWHYLLLVNIYLVLFYGFYALLLRKETFFQLNRLYLVSASLLSFIIPLIQPERVKHLAITEQVHYSIYGGNINISAYKPIESSPITIGEVFMWLYLTGIAFLTIRFIIQLIKVNRLINAPTPTSAAYSFFKKVSLGENMVKQDVVMAHEQVHAKQWHSLDVLLIEAVMIINWFNPVVYLYRFAIKHIHEFIADQQAIKVGADKVEYALLLLSQTFSAPSHHLVNPFFTHSLLKKRIIMIQKNKSHRIVLFKYILSAPLFGLMLVLSSATINNSKAVASIHNQADSVFSEGAMATINGMVQHGEIPENGDEAVTTDVDYQQGQDQQDKVYDKVDKLPMFPGGTDAFAKFLAGTVHYPTDARQANIQGKVLVQFVVERDGSVTDVKAVKGPSESLKNEAVRGIKRSPKWQPGMVKGKKVRTMFTAPVNFSLSKIQEIVLTPPAETKDERPTPDKNKVYDAVEKEPQFPGGRDAFNKYLANTIKYPADARKAGVQGKSIIQFVVEEDGTLTDIKAIRGPSEELNNEAIRAVKKSPKWIPGMQNGRLARVSYSIPVNFTLEGMLGVIQIQSYPSGKPQEEAIASKDPNKVYDAVEKEPDFPGGMDAFNKFLSQTVRYPAVDRDNNRTGKVIVQFIVEQDGTLTDVKAIRGPSTTMNEAAVKAIITSPKWKPGVQNGRAVRVNYTVPVNFTLNPGNNAPKEDIPPVGDSKVYDAVQKEPEFPGGMDAFNRFLSQNVKYPAADRENNVTGKVIIQFIVEKDGSLSDVRGIRGPSETTIKEATRAIALSPKWKPGMQNGKPERVSYTVPVNFTLQSDNKIIGTTYKPGPDAKLAIDNLSVNGQVPLFIVDGVESKGASFNNLNPQNIISISVLKNDSAMHVYGKKGEHGAVVVITKNGAIKK